MIDKKNSPDNMLQDDENRSLFETGAKVRRAAAEIPEIDVDAEWQKFKGKAKSRRWFMQPFTWRNAAAVAAFLAVAAVTASVGVGLNKSFLSDNNTEETTDENAPNLVADAKITEAPADSLAIEPADVNVIYVESKVYDNIPVKEILEDIVNRSGVVTECSDDVADVRLYLSVKAGSTLKDVAALIGAFDQINAELTEDENGQTKLSVK